MPATKDYNKHQYGRSFSSGSSEYKIFFNLQMGANYQYNNDCIIDRQHSERDERSNPNRTCKFLMRGRHNLITTCKSEIGFATVPMEFLFQSIQLPSLFAKPPDSIMESGGLVWMALEDASHKRRTYGIVVKM